MKPSKTPPAAFKEVLTITEGEALAILGQPDTSANRSALRAKLPHTGTAANPRFYDADIRHMARTGTVPTGSRSESPKMTR